MKEITLDQTGFESIEIYGAREHNLKDLTISIPRNQLIVITGISGSGKSSLAFDTIYAEAQRRYMESFSAYARSFLGNMERPDVDKINGLSPVISIEQKTTVRNPRSTVGTTTEIYDFMRLLFARTGIAYSYISGKPMIQQTEEQVLHLIMKNYPNQKLNVLAPIIKGRKGHYKELFVQIRKMGFTKVRIDGELQDIVPKMQVDRYKNHDIEILIDRIKVDKKDTYRISESVKLAMERGNGSMLIENEKSEITHFSKALVDPESGLSYEEPAPNSFSFNSPYGYCPTCKGLGVVEEINQESIMPNMALSIAKGGIAPLGEYRDIWIFKKIESILKKNKFRLSTPLSKLNQKTIDTLLYGSDEKVKVSSKKYPGTKWETTFEGLIKYLKQLKIEGPESIQKWLMEYTASSTCPDCEGSRLKKESRHFKFAGKTIFELSSMNIGSLKNWFDGVEKKLNKRQVLISKEVLKEIKKRICFLSDVGLDYLDCNRPLKTLSGGEAQRIRLATQIGTQLVGVLYILDEPSIGLHQRDNVKLIKALQDLRDIGNSVIVVEHDKEMMLASDFVIDIGPGAGVHGGEIVAAGHPKQFLKQGSTTAAYLNGKVEIPVPKKRRKGNGLKLKLNGASGNNLKNLNVVFPLGKMIGITGVSGSGKSSLIHETLYPILHQHVYRFKKPTLPYKNIEGLKHIDKVIEVDQSPIGRTPRSNPATYTGVFTDIRNLFKELPEAKIRGYKAGRFSFNVKGGRCEDCGGGGLRLIEMGILPDIYILCETCKGKRYNRETLEVRYKGKSISDVLDMTIDNAVTFFETLPKINRKIKTLQDVGLGYLSLGQHATTLSGGEAQRVKLATELSKRDTGTTFYILDEPTTGLHFQDVQHLLNVLNKLVDKGNTVLIVEHNLEVIKAVDHIIDIGPEGGTKGGEIVAQGTPEKVSKAKNSFTAKFLLDELS